MSTTDPVSGTSSTSGNVPARRSLSAEGLNFIERHEGYRGKIYPDSAGNPTIGYGHLIRSGEDFSSGITRAQALQLLTQDTSTAVDSVNNKVKTNLTQTQFDALVDFTFNLGAAALARSALLRNVNAGQAVTLENFTNWNHAGGQAIPGLTKRRTDEFHLYARGDYGVQGHR